MRHGLHPAIRPSVSQLRELPTLRSDVLEFDDHRGTFELKFETPTRRYWICTAPPTTSVDLPPYFRPDRVTMEILDAENDASHWLSYGLEETRELQMFDYFQLLGHQLDELLARENPESLEDTRQELEAIRSEFESFRRLWSQHVGETAPRQRESERTSA